MKKEIDSTLYRTELVTEIEHLKDLIQETGKAGGKDLNVSEIRQLAENARAEIENFTKLAANAEQASRRTDLFLLYPAALVATGAFCFLLSVFLIFIGEMKYNVSAATVSLAIWLFGVIQIGKQLPGILTSKFHSWLVRNQMPLCFGLVLISALNLPEINVLERVIGSTMIALLMLALQRIRSSRTPDSSESR